MTDFDNRGWYNPMNYCEIADFCGWLYGPTLAPGSKLKAVPPIKLPANTGCVNGDFYYKPVAMAVDPPQKSYSGMQLIHGGMRKEVSTSFMRALYGPATTNRTATTSTVVTAAAAASDYTFSPNWTIALFNGTTTKYFVVQLLYQPFVGCVNQPYPV